MSPSTQCGATAQYTVPVCDNINYEKKKDGADRKALVQTLLLGNLLDVPMCLSLETGFPNGDTWSEDRSKILLCITHFIQTSGCALLC